MTPQRLSAAAVLRNTHIIIAAVAILAIAAHLVLRLTVPASATFHGWPLRSLPLLIGIAAGLPLVWRLLVNLARFDFSSDLLAGISIVTSVILGEYLAGTL